MDARVVFLKTAKGETEITTRAHKLNHALRYVLILVDGKSTVGEIMSKGAGLSNITDALDQLAALDFIHTIAETKLSTQYLKQDPKTKIISMVNDLLGERAGPIIKKLHVSDESPEALEQSITACKHLIKLTIDNKKAEDFVRRAQEIIFASTVQHRY
jgi:hypothetical protein